MDKMIRRRRAFPPGERHRGRGTADFSALDAPNGGFLEPRPEGLVFSKSRGTRPLANTGRSSGVGPADGPIPVFPPLRTPTGPQTSSVREPDQLHTSGEHNTPFIDALLTEVSLPVGIRVKYVYEQKTAPHF